MLHLGCCSAHCRTCVLPRADHCMAVTFVYSCRNLSTMKVEAHVCWFVVLVLAALQAGRPAQRAECAADSDIAAIIVFAWGLLCAVIEACHHCPCVRGTSVRLSQVRLTSDLPKQQVMFGSSSAVQKRLGHAACRVVWFVLCQSRWSLIQHVHSKCSMYGCISGCAAAA
jgi:hypothetical protein